MKGDKTMNDNMSSETALQNNEPIELTELFVQKRKTVTLLDTVTIQSILCVIAAILFVSVNIFNNGLAFDIYEIYWSKSTVQESIGDTFRVLLDFLRSTPLS